MDNNSLATEILHELRVESKRRFIVLIISIVALVLSNMAWLVAWNLPDNTVSESYELQGEDSANVIYNQLGEVEIGEQNPSEQNENITNEQ